MPVSVTCLPVTGATVFMSGAAAGVSRGTSGASGGSDSVAVVAGVSESLAESLAESGFVMPIQSQRPLSSFWHCHGLSARTDCVIGSSQLQVSNIAVQVCFKTVPVYFSLS